MSRLLSPSYDMAAALQTSLARANYEKDFASRWSTMSSIKIFKSILYFLGIKFANIDRVLGGTVGTIHLGRDSTAGFDPVATAVKECYGTTRCFLMKDIKYLFYLSAMATLF